MTFDGREALLELARVAVYRAAGALGTVEVLHHAVFDRRAGAFVTLRVSGALRGCVGTPGADGTLGQIVTHCAAAAAREDPRFRPLQAVDLVRLSIEVSVLSPLVRCAGPEGIVIGRHGLIVEQKGRRGLLLPQVAAARGWSPVMFLEHTCVKAGLAADAWRGGAVIQRFEADVFGDREGPRSPGARTL